jgi:hypothetical protein
VPNSNSGETLHNLREMTPSATRLLNLTRMKIQEVLQLFVQTNSGAPPNDTELGKRSRSDETAFTASDDEDLDGLFQKSTDILSLSEKVMQPDF